MNWEPLTYNVVIALWPSELGDCTECKRLAVQTLSCSHWSLWSKTILENDTKEGWNLTQTGNILINYRSIFLLDVADIASCPFIIEIVLSVRLEKLLDRIESVDIFFFCFWEKYRDEKLKNCEDVEFLGSTVFKIFFPVFALKFSWEYLGDFQNVYKSPQLTHSSNTTLKCNIFKFYSTWLLLQCFCNDLYRCQVKPACLM